MSNSATNEESKGSSAGPTISSANALSRQPSEMVGNLSDDDSSETEDVAAGEQEGAEGLNSDVTEREIWRKIEQRKY